MRALVTGGGGFLGRHIVGVLLARGDAVTVLARGDYPDLERRGARMVRGDVAEPRRVREAVAGAETVFHVAAKAGLGGRYRDYHRTNVVGTSHVIAACREHGVRRLIYTSTPSVVIGLQDIRGGDERLPYTTTPFSHYQATKIIAERMVLAANRDGLSTTALRPHAIWGPGDTKLLPRLISRAARGRLRRVGSGDNRISATYVVNAAAAHLQAAESPHVAGKAYFINEPEPINLWAWLDELLRSLGLAPVRGSIPFALAYAVGAGLEWLHRASPGAGEPAVTRYLAALLAKDHYFSVARAVRDFGFHSPIDLEAGLRESIEYYGRGVHS